jgi:hypothetical protein
VIPPNPIKRNCRILIAIDRRYQPLAGGNSLPGNFLSKIKKVNVLRIISAPGTNCSK